MPRVIAPDGTSLSEARIVRAAERLHRHRQQAGHMVARARERLARPLGRARKRFAALLMAAGCLR